MKGFYFDPKQDNNIAECLGLSDDSLKKLLMPLLKILQEVSDNPRLQETNLKFYQAVEESVKNCENKQELAMVFYAAGKTFEEIDRVIKSHALTYAILGGL
jgi:hypothetical protein